MMKFLQILLVLCFGFSALGQEIKVRPFPMDSSSLLWKIEGDSVHGEAYLFGTIHLIPESRFYFPDTLKYINQHVDLVLLELDLGEDMMSYMDLLMLKEGSFFDYFNAAQEDSILQWAEAMMQINEEQFRMAFGRLKPFVVATLAATVSSKEPQESYDVNINQLAEEAGISVEGLETFEEQLAMFDATPPEEQAAMVMSAINDQDTLSAHTLVDLYLDQHVDSLYLYSMSENGSALDMKLFLDERNAKWISKIETAIRTKDTFIAVGAGHLGGSNGVIRLLERAGYTLTPIQL